MDDFHHRIPPWFITLVLHNWPVMLYSLLIPVAAVRAYLRPGRPVLLVLYGLILLAVEFEYEKHGLEPVRGTLDYVFERLPGWRQAGYLLLLDILPVAAQLSGLALVLLGLVMARRPSAVMAGGPRSEEERFRT